MGASSAPRSTGVTTTSPDTALDPSLAPGMHGVLCWAEAPKAALHALLGRVGLEIRECHAGGPIPGSYWGPPEAGLIGGGVYLREDTPVHSLLHEACHYVCMDPSRRASLDTDAGGDYAEENAVCYLQILLADLIPGLGAQRMLRDMDAWGYTFRLGSARAWFEEDALEARDWLYRQGLIDPAGRPTWSLRLDEPPQGRGHPHT